MNPEELSAATGSTSSVRPAPSASPAPSARPAAPDDGLADKRGRVTARTPRPAASVSPEALVALDRLVEVLTAEGAEPTAGMRGQDPPPELDAVVRRLRSPDRAARPVVRLAQLAVALRLERDNLHLALETNRTISAAVGIIMALHHLTHDDAFDLLVSVSQNHNRKLRDVAEAVLRTGLLPGDDAG